MAVELGEIVTLRDTYLEVPQKLIPVLMADNLVVKRWDGYASSPDIADLDAIVRIRKAIELYNKHKEPLAPETLRAMGFTSYIPAGNPKEPTWRHPMLPRAFFSDGAPSMADIIEEIHDRGIYEGRERVRHELKRALGLNA